MLANDLPHSLHLYGFSPVCVRTCLVKFILHLNFLPHSLHSNGFSPVCVRIWSINSCFCENDLQATPEKRQQPVLLKGRFSRCCGQHSVDHFNSLSRSIFEVAVFRGLPVYGFFAETQNLNLQVCDRDSRFERPQTVSVPQCDTKCGLCSQNTVV